MNVDEKLPDFTGNLVVFYLSAAAGEPKWLTDGVVLQSPKFELQGGRLFVKGRTLDNSADGSEKEWSDDREASLAWDAVLFYIPIPPDEFWAFRKRDDERDAAGDEVS